MLQVPLASGVYRLMGASAEVTRAAETYFTVRIWSAPFALANYVLLGWFVGLARANVALALQVAINLINAVAIALLVLVFDLGVAGAALAAVDRRDHRHGSRPHRRAARRRRAHHDWRACSTAPVSCGCS